MQQKRDLFIKLLNNDINDFDDDITIAKQNEIVDDDDDDESFDYDVDDDDVIFENFDFDYCVLN